MTRTPEDIIRGVLRSSGRNSALSHLEADRIMRELKLSGFTVEDELGPRRFTREEVAKAVNRAADEMEPGDDEYETSATILAIDRANLFANLAMGYLDDPAAAQDQVIGASYSEDPDTVRGWSGL